MRRVLTISARLLLIGVLLWGGLVKVYDPDSFGYVVWRVSGRAVAPNAAIIGGVLLAAIEIVLSLWMLTRFRSVQAIRAALALIAFFTLVLLRLAFMDEAPGCGCLSIPGLRGSPIEHSVGIVRNIGLIWMAILLIQIDPVGHTGQRMDRAQASRPNGFTLVELLISISLLAILIGLTLPALTNVNLEGKLTRMKLMQRQLSIATFQYTEDHAATFPYFATPRDPYGPVVIGGITFTDGPPYFKRPVSDWATALVPSYIPSASSIEHPSMRDILAREGHPSLVRAQSAISASVFADPAFFTNEARHRPMEEAHFRATRTFEVRFPSDKGLLTTWGAPGARPYAAVFETAGFPITFADGATIAWQRGRITSLPSVDVPWLGNIQIHTTPNGIAGRDRALPTPH